MEGLEELCRGWPQGEGYVDGGWGPLERYPHTPSPRPGTAALFGNRVFAE